MLDPTTGKASLKPEDMQVNWNFFNKILEKNDFTKMNMLEVCSAIYERTYLFYGIRFLEEYHRAEDLTKKVVEKVTEIEDLKDKVKGHEEKIRSLVAICKDKGVDCSGFLGELGDSEYRHPSV